MSRWFKNSDGTVNQVDIFLKEGIAAVKTGQRNKGRKLLREVVRLRPDHVTAWLWLSSVVESDPERRQCLENVLAIEPDNAHAKKGLRKLGSHMKSAPANTQPATASEAGDEHTGTPAIQATGIRRAGSDNQNR